MDVDRRGILQSLAAGLLLSPALAEAQAVEEGPLFSSGPLASNAVAQSFIVPRLAIELPRTRLLGPDREYSMSELTGRARIVSLWAEWCVPCLVEAKDLATLRSQFGGARFDILAILTAGRSALSPAGARDRLDGIGARNLPTWVEPDNGRKVGLALAVQVPPHISLPCNVIVDRKGRIRGRSIGNGLLASSSGGRSHWASPDARAFVKALHDGALDHVEPGGAGPLRRRAS